MRTRIINIHRFLTLACEPVAISPHHIWKKTVVNIRLLEIPSKWEVCYVYLQRLLFLFRLFKVLCILNAKTTVSGAAVSKEALPSIPIASAQVLPAVLAIPAVLSQVLSQYLWKWCLWIIRHRDLMSLRNFQVLTTHQCRKCSSKTFLFVHSCFRTPC